MLGEIQANRKTHIFSNSLLKKLRRRPHNNNYAFLSLTDEVKSGRNERTHQGYATQSGFKLRTSEPNPGVWTTHSFSSLCSLTVLGHVAAIGEMRNRCRSMNRWGTSPGWSLEDNAGLFSSKEDSKEPQRQHPCPKTEAALPHTVLSPLAQQVGVLRHGLLSVSKGRSLTDLSDLHYWHLCFSGMPINIAED